MGVRHVEAHTKKRMSGQLGPRLKRAIQAVTTEADRVRPIDTISLKSCSFFTATVTIYDRDISLIVTKTATEPQPKPQP